MQKNKGEEILTKSFEFLCLPTIPWSMSDDCMPGKFMGEKP